jgi:hypothetical protein
MCRPRMSHRPAPAVFRSLSPDRPQIIPAQRHGRSCPETRIPVPFLPRDTDPGGRVGGGRSGGTPGRPTELTRNVPRRLSLTEHPAQRHGSWAGGWPSWVGSPQPTPEPCEIMRTCAVPAQRHGGRHRLPRSEVLPGSRSGSLPRKGWLLAASWFTTKTGPGCLIDRPRLTDRVASSDESGCLGLRIELPRLSNRSAPDNKPTGPGYLIDRPRLSHRPAPAVSSTGPGCLIPRPRVSQRPG